MNRITAAVTAAVLTLAAAPAAFYASPSHAQEAIAAPGLNVQMRRTRGGANVFAGRPKVALGAYNVAPFITTRVSASSGGLITAGARVRMDYELAGVTPEMMVRVADAAHADLVAQLTAAGFEVIPANEVAQNANVGPLRSSEPTFEGEEPGTGSKLMAFGPTGVGAVSAWGVGRMGFANMNGLARLSHELDAVILLPNLVLDFTETSGSGRNNWRERASAQGQARFSVDPLSKAEAFFSRAGRFADGWGTLQVTAPAWSDAPFATVEQITESNNNLAVALSAVLGAGMQSSRREGYVVNADPAAYEALALQAARGFNAALVEQIRQARADGR